MKGHEGNTYFWFTFVFGIVGMLMVIALPNIEEVTIKNKPTVLSSQTSTIISQKEKTDSNGKTTHSWRCAACNNMRTKSPCEHCGYDEEKQHIPYWCGNCGHAGPYDDRCPTCGSSLKKFNVSQN